VNVRRKKAPVLFALVAALALGASACGGGGGGGSSGTSNGGTLGGPVKKGGTFRVGAESSFNYTGGFDPTGEYLATAFSQYGNLMLRTLMGYNHVAGAPGNQLIPDLAESEPQVSDDGKTYTFKIRQGVKFGPPVSRPVTSKDVEYSFERICDPKLVAQYGFYYTPIIEGMADCSSGKVKGPISGIETPDDQTIIFHLTQKVGDFLYRLSMPATAPIPPEIGKCFTKAGDYGRDVVSTGPYMIEGADQASKTCSGLKPMPGFNPNKQLILVRNPDYDPSTDTKEARENFPDRFEFLLNTNVNDIFNKVTAGEYELSGSEVASVPPTTLRQYSTSSNLKNRLKIESGDRTWYITMNLTQPPFDDIHVRKAANWVMDKSGLQRSWGGPLKGDISTHIVPDTMFNGDLDSYDPYSTPNHTGDVAKAKAEMKQSKYDSNQDGVCDADVCKNVLHVTRSTAQWVAMEPIIEQSLAKIGIQVKSREFEDAYPIIQTTSKNIPISSVPGWGKDYADASTFMVLFDSRSILPEGNVNYSLVGVTPDMKKKLGLSAESVVTGIPSVDDKIDACNVKTGDDRLKCWEDLDKYLMENVVPWVPYLDATNVDVLAPDVTKWNYDQSATTTAWAHVAVDKSKAK
jgi:peptide/nickel transport system substrate-binding protein